MVSWFRVIVFVVSMVSWFHRFRGVNAFMVMGVSGFMVSFYRFGGVNGFMVSSVSWCQRLHGFLGFVVSMVS